ncbi:restriction modification system DNA specificity domain protein [Calothrix sp. NIES-2100]|uniref:restriction endonuclease subunit S n=1 Tax=Calothrix sp. NIES-2100 TaxID=1954172 RepID=UPI000B5FF671|nr:restriction modification system DNA specificity domain protein [Calothrix sp. NIES-2100]
MNFAASLRKAPNINAGVVNNMVFPLAPLEEQKRIVEKCDRLLSTCDEIEKRQQQRQESILRMNESAIAQLLSSQNPDDFRQHWQRICNNFDLLYSIPETIPKLRQAILQLAVQGKLVRQDPNDEPASILLQKIRDERAKLDNEGKIHQSKLLSQIDKYNELIKLPSGWIWCRFGEVIDCYRGHNPPKHEFIREPREGYVRFIQITDFKTDKEAVYVPIAKQLKYVYKGEIAMAAYRHIGKLSRNVEGAFNVAICKVTEIPPMNRDYIEKLIGSDFVKGELLKASGRAHIPSMHTNHLLSLVVPLPPLAEQKRIVEKCDRLMSLCDILETKLKQGRDSSGKLMEVAAKQVLAS